MGRRKTIGAVSYLNTRPLIHGLDRILPGWELRLDLPSRLADSLHAGELDAGLVPVVELFSGAGYQIVSDACIACDGPVWSVKLVSRVAPRAIRTIALDEGSRTSVCLVRLLLDHFWGVDPVRSSLPIDADWRQQPADAVLMIGDRAMNNDSAGFPWQWDLGELWREWTGLPFVFAVWAARPGAHCQLLDEALSRARDGGLEAAATIARQHGASYGLSESQCLRYLREYLRFRLGPKERAGLERFRELAVEAGMVPRAEGLQFFRDCVAA